MTRGEGTTPRSAVRKDDENALRVGIHDVVNRRQVQEVERRAGEVGEVGKVGEGEMLICPRVREGGEPVLKEEIRRRKEAEAGQNPELGGLDLDHGQGEVTEAVQVVLQVQVVLPPPPLRVRTLKRGGERNTWKRKG